jgi:long-chain acyl-CoA synthetase
MHSTLTAYLDQWNKECPERVWLRQYKGETFEDWTWAQAYTEINALGVWLESYFEGCGHKLGLLSENRPHWYFADLGSIAAGNVVVPMFTTLIQETADYMMSFTEMKLLFVGETSNWDQVKKVLPKNITLVCLPGVEVEVEHLRWDDIVAPHRGSKPTYQCQPKDLVSLVFTSGTTGVPKGVMQTHESNIIPASRGRDAFGLENGAKQFSYLPLAHIAERQIVEVGSLMHCGEVHFNESLEFLLRDLQRCRPNMVFGPPRVWEQLQQGIIAQFGSPEAVNAALEADADGVGKMIRQKLGLDQAQYLLTAAAPTPPALIHWYERFGILLMEGFGQTECMGPILSSLDNRRVGSIGKAVAGVDVRISDNDELQIRAEGCSPGYYEMPEKTAEVFVDGWVHTGDKVKLDEDGYYYITGRVKDYFKTIQGKFVAPTPIENLFAENPYTEQICLLGRGFSKTVMVCVLSAAALEIDDQVVETALIEKVECINADIESHARIGAVIISTEAWTNESALLTPTMKIRREKIDELFGGIAQQLAEDAAKQGKILLQRT